MPPIGGKNEKKSLGIQPGKKKRKEAKPRSEGYQRRRSPPWGKKA